MPIWLRVLGQAGHSRVALRAVDMYCVGKRSPSSVRADVEGRLSSWRARPLQGAASDSRDPVKPRALELWPEMDCELLALSMDDGRGRSAVPHLWSYRSTQSRDVRGRSCPRPSAVPDGDRTWVRRR